MKILICDDAAFMRMMLKDMILKLGHEVIGEAKNGKEAIDKYKELKPDLVTMDITMPDVDGLEGLKGIMDYDRNAKVIMCSAMGQEAMVLESIKTGAKDFIVKPFKVERVRDALEKFK